MLPEGTGIPHAFSRRPQPAIWLLVLLLSILPSKLLAATQIDYVTQIKPIFKERCYACHGALKQQGKLRVDTVALLRQGGKHGAVITSGRPESSRLMERVIAREEDERMPPEGEPLKPEQIQLIQLWIAQGAMAPVDEQPEADPKDHWAFKAPVRPSVPRVKAREWSQNPIDAFIASAQQQHGLKPQPVAEKSLWLRRVYLDLTGLPPSLVEIQAFEADKSSQAYEKVVDRLLASPQYGERWGRHFMDIWRYSDWYGLGEQLRYSQKHLWHWRDWIVESLNHDKGYDRMVMEMLAGDEIAPTDRDTLRATGFLARNYYLFNRTTWLDDVVEHTSKAFLGITMNCAKCHDHKYDPITSKDYYAWRAFFEPYHVRLDELPGQANLEKDGLPRAYDAHLDTPTYLHVRGDEKNPDKSKEITPTVPVVFKLREQEIKPVELPPEGYNPALQVGVYQNHLIQAQSQLKEAQAALDKAREQAAEAEKIVASAGEKTSVASLKYHDDFRHPDTALWQQIDGQWQYVADGVKQTETGSQRRMLRSQMKHPADFRAKFRFKITGGEKWKSAGFSFDADNTHDVLIYLSAHTSSKLQVAISENGKSSYPPQGAFNRPVKTDVVYELDIYVQGRQLTVLVDGEEALSFELPDRRPGLFQLVTFDASAEFQDFALYELPAGFVRTPINGEAKLNASKLALAAATKNHEVAERRLAALQSAHQADEARFSKAKTANVQGLLARASADAVAWKVAESEALDAKFKADTASLEGKKKTDAAKKYQTAKEAIAKELALFREPTTNYFQLRGSQKALEGPDETDEHRKIPFPETSTGRRTALAQWITNTQNPLTARVAVNHVWLRHFGQPLVTTVMDFGRRGAAPTHPELLDWLAVEFMESDWSLKHMHRLMVLSRTYRLSSSNADASKASLANDAENKYYWRMNPVRMEAQSVRDSLLLLSGQLDLTLGGPTIDPEKEDTLFRRSLYFTHSKEDVHKFLETFDNANVLDCYRRSESVLPQQALALSNSKLSLAAAGKLAENITQSSPAMTDDAFINVAYQTVLATKPSKAESEACGEALMELRSLAEKQGQPEPVKRARAGLVHALFNHNDFITVR